MIPRILETAILQRLGKKKVIMLLGPRQVGKTTLVDKILKEFRGKTSYLTGDDPAIRARLSDAPLDRLRQLASGVDLIVLDEAQRIKNIGITLKLLVDHLPETQVIATGSSSFDLANEINEPLTGRKFELNLFPIAWQEWASHTGTFQAEAGLEHRLLYGMYPEVLTNPGKEKEILANLATSNLYKDLLSYGSIRKPEFLEKILQALALQVGAEVSLNELSNLVQIDKKTVESYIGLLEKAFVILRLGPFSRNLRNEISRTRKIYFYDNGIRNALIGNFQPMSLRQDTGALWENFLVSERMKANHYSQRWFVNSYFWRTRQQQEIDYLEENNGEISAFEFKWNPKSRARFPRSFMESYPVKETAVVNSENFPPFLNVEARPE
jgi:uncharacterized protein